MLVEPEVLHSAENRSIATVKIHGAEQGLDRCSDHLISDEAAVAFVGNDAKTNATLASLPS